ncbi:hypothetical protein V5O48_001219 [Marasmius crinis-equi]|uniref:Ribosomal protein S11 n=1 Tax=Marasmius crinis-equi TaxID=585013 RepID=A0ABR3FYW3_9AGAR
MLGLQAWRSSLRSARQIPTLAARYSQQIPPVREVSESDASTSSSNTSSPEHHAGHALLDDISGPSSESTQSFSATGPPVGGVFPKGRSPPPKNDSSPASAYKRPRYRLHCHSTRNNTITNFTAPDGATIAQFSGGSVGFKRGQRSGYEAGYQCAVRAFEKILQIEAKSGPLYLELFFKGFGQGRDALQKALLAAEGDPIRKLVISVTDRTPIKIGGTRSKKARRL